MSNLFKPATPKKPDMSIVMIDKVSIVINVDDPQYHGLVFSELLNTINDIDTPLANHHKYSSAYPLSSTLFCPDIDGQITTDNPAMTIQSTKTTHKRPHFRLEFNPHKLFVPAYSSKMDEETDYMSCYLNEFFEGTFGMEFHQLIQHGKITRMDLCVDISGYSPSDFILGSSHSLKSQNVLDKKGNLGSTYLGSSKSTQYVMYDKAAALYGIDTDIKLTRFEWRGKPNLMIPNIHLAKNPFKTMRVHELHSLDTLPAPFDVGYIAALKDSLRFRGIRNAIKQQPKPRQKLIKNFLSDNKAEWWGFEDTWEDQWQRAITWTMLSHKPSYVPSMTAKELCG